MSTRKAILVALATALLLTVFSPAAQADLSFCPPGTGAGQCAKPQGVATDFETGRAYVADRSNNRVDVFKAETGEFLFAFGWGVDTGAATFEKCTTASTCQAGIAGAGTGQFSGPRSVAIDNVEGSANRHDVYVTDGENNRISHFKEDGTFVAAFGWGVLNGAATLQSCTTGSGCQAGNAVTESSLAGECQLGGLRQPISVGPGGDVFAAITTGEEPNFTAKVEKFSPAGACLGETVLLVGNHRMTTFAVDGNEDAYVNDERQGAHAFKFDLATAAQLCALDNLETFVLGLDATGHLFAFQREDPAKKEGIYRVVAEYGGSCNPVRRFGYDKIDTNSFGLAPLPTAQGDVLLSEEGEGINYLATPPPGPIIVPGSLSASPLRSVWAALEAEVNPEGKATNVLVEWVDRDSYEHEGGWASPAKRSSGEVPLGSSAFRVAAAEALAGCKPFSDAALAEGKCLKPETEYRYRLIAKNADGEDELEGQFTTLPPLQVEQTYSTEVGTDGAGLNAVLNPNGSHASGYFEYVDDAAFQANLAKGPGHDGFEGASRLPDPQPPAGEAALDFGSGEGAIRRSVGLFPLPEGTTYHYRLVVTDPFVTIATPERSLTTFSSPTPTSCPANEAFRTGAAALLPDCRGYEMVSPLDKASGDIVVLPQQLSSLPAAINQAAVSGDRLTYGSYRAFGDAQSAPYTSQYLAERGPDGWSGHGITPPQGALIKNLTFNFEFDAFSEDLCQGWLVPTAEPTLAPGASPGHRNLYSRTDQLCGGAPDYKTISAAKPENLATDFELEPQGISADGSVAFAANDTLVGSGAPSQPSCNCQRLLYVKGPSGAPRYACVLPGGAPSTGPCSAGTGSVNGFSKARSSSLTNALSADGKRLYWTDSKGDGRVYLRQNPLGKGAECSGTTAPCTYPVSDPVESHFWAAAEDGSKAIFTSGNLANSAATLYEFDASAKASTPIAGEVAGVLGTSEDASRVYFVSREVPAGAGANSEGDQAQAGKPNLYLHEAGGGDRFVATLAAADVRLSPPIGSGASSATAIEPLAHNGRASASGLQAAFMSEAPLTGYDNVDAASGKADNEVYVYDATAKGGAGELLCASCNPSGARPAGGNLGEALNPFWSAARLPVTQSSLYGSHLLSPDGSRLFFESQDALVPRDTNGRLDVYQWERAGSGGCEESLPAYSPAAAGCIDLISSGQSGSDSTLLDASASGEDVFFTTLSSLYAADYGLTDVYDARVNGGFPAPAKAEGGCEGEACQGPYTPPNDPTPASSSFEGAGNVATAKAKHKKRAKKKHRKRSQKKPRKLASHGGQSR